MNIDEIKKRILTRPETYKTLIPKEYGRNTKTVIIRRKINKELKRGILGQVNLPGTRGKEALIFHFEKNYNIITFYDHRDCRYIVVWGKIKEYKNMIEVNNAQELVDEFTWKDLKTPMKIDKSNILKCI